MHIFQIRSVVAALALTLAPVALVAQQQPAPTHQQQPSAEVQGWITEIQQLEQRLGPIQARAMEDPQLQQAQTELNAAVIAALTQGDAAVQADLRRVETIQPELRAAQESGDQAQFQRLATEAQQLQQRLAQAQAHVMQQPEIAAQADAFQTRLQTRMVEVDPEAEALIQRFVALQAQIIGAMEQP